MNLTIKKQALKASPVLLHLLAQILKERKVDESAITLNFRDPKYSPEQGGYHPVEIRINAKNEIEYITDFAFYGMPPFAELEKCLDFDFRYEVLQSNGIEFPIRSGEEIFEIWQDNFCKYHDMGVYTLSVELG